MTYIQKLFKIRLLRFIKDNKTTRQQDNKTTRQQDGKTTRQQGCKLFYSFIFCIYDGSIKGSGSTSD